MKNRTRNNIRKAAEMIMAKGYDRVESISMAWIAFRTARENKFDHPVEFYINQIPTTQN